MSNPGYDERHYHTFVLRLWQERDATPSRPAVWRFILKDTRTRQRRGFGNLEELVGFLRSQIGHYGRSDTTPFDTGGEK